MKCNFVVGQKVVCVDDSFSAIWHEPLVTGDRMHLPVAHAVYTVRGVVVFPFSNGDEPAIYLTEIVNPKVPFWDGGCLEQAFWAERFRPVQERKTDISVFTKMLLLTEECVK